MGNDLENSDGFETIRLMGNDLVKSRGFVNFFLLYAQKISGRNKKFPGSNSTQLLRFLQLCQPLTVLGRIVQLCALLHNTRPLRIFGTDHISESENIPSVVLGEVYIYMPQPH